MLAVCKIDLKIPENRRYRLISKIVFFSSFLTNAFPIISKILLKEVDGKSDNIGNVFFVNDG